MQSQPIDADHEVVDMQDEATPLDETVETAAPQDLPLHQELEEDFEITAEDSAPEGAGDGEADLGEALEAEPEEDEDGAGTRKVGPGEELSDAELVRHISALLFASVEPLTLGKLVNLLQKPRRGRVKSALVALEERLRESELPMQVRAIKGGYALMTEPELGPVVERLISGSTIERVSAAALETLAVVAYRQPVTKAEIEAIRGVQAGPILRSLVDRGLIKVAGRADVPGSPLQYATTKDFLDRFGLQGVSDLPRDAELA